MAMKPVDHDPKAHVHTCEHAGASDHVAWASWDASCEECGTTYTVRGCSGTGGRVMPPNPKIPGTSTGLIACRCGRTLLVRLPSGALEDTLVASIYKSLPPASSG
jgi:hypothetical protein